MDTIAAYRRASEMTQQQLAVRLGVTVTTVANWEQGKYDPNARQFRELCRVFAIGLDELRLPSDVKLTPPPPDDRSP